MAETVKRRKRPLAPPPPGMERSRPVAPPPPGMEGRRPLAPPPPGMEGRRPIAPPPPGGDPLDFDFDFDSDTFEDVINEQHPDVSYLGDRSKIMTLATPEGGKRLLEKEGFEVRHRGAYDYDIRKPGEKQWRKLDPVGPDRGDVVDIAGDALDTITGILAALGLVGSTKGFGLPKSAAAFGGGVAASQLARYGLGGMLGIPNEPGESAKEAATAGALSAAGDITLGLAGRHLVAPALKKLFPTFTKDELLRQGVQEAVGELPESLQAKLASKAPPSDYSGEEKGLLLDVIERTVRGRSDDELRHTVLIEGVADATTAARSAGKKPRDRITAGTFGYPQHLDVLSRAGISKTPEGGERSFEGLKAMADSIAITTKGARKLPRPLANRLDGILALQQMASTDPGAIGQKIALKKARDIKKALRERGQEPTRKNLGEVIDLTDRLRPIDTETKSRDYSKWMRDFTDEEVESVLRNAKATDDQILFAMSSPEERIALSLSLSPQDLARAGAPNTLIAKATGLRREALRGGGRPLVDVNDIPASAKRIGVSEEHIRGLREQIIDWLHKEQPGYVSGKGSPEKLQNTGRKIFDEEVRQWRTINPDTLRSITLEGGEDALEMLGRRKVGMEAQHRDALGTLAGMEYRAPGGLRGATGRGLGTLGGVLDYPWRKGQEWVGSLLGDKHSGVMPNRLGKLAGSLLGDPRTAGILAGLSFISTPAQAVLGAGIAGKAAKGISKLILKDPSSVMLRFLRGKVGPKAHQIAQQVLNTQRTKGKEAARVLVYMIMQDAANRAAIEAAAETVGIKLEENE